MEWLVRLHPDFVDEFRALSVAVRRKLLGHAGLLEKFGPTLGRPWVDTLNGSRYANMKELRFIADGGIWRVVFAFDSERNAVLLAAGDKSHIEEGRFYKRLIAKADERFAADQNNRE